MLCQQSDRRYNPIMNSEVFADFKNISDFVFSLNYSQFSQLIATISIVHHNIFQTSTLKREENIHQFLES